MAILLFVTAILSAACLYFYSAKNSIAHLPAVAESPAPADSLIPPAKPTGYGIADVEGDPFNYHITGKCAACLPDPAGVTEESKEAKPCFLYLMADADTGWVKIDSAETDSECNFEFRGIAPGKGMYKIDRDVWQNQDYPEFYGAFLRLHWNIILPLDSNKVHIIPILKPVYDEYKDSVITANPLCKSWLAFRDTVRELNDHLWELEGAEFPAVHWPPGEYEKEYNPLAKEVRKHLAAFSDSPLLYFAIRYAYIDGTLPQNKPLFKKLINKMKKCGLSARRLASVENEITP